MPTEDLPYRILTGRNASVLSKMVSEVLEQGFALHGHPFASESGYAQCVVKIKNNRVNWEMLARLNEPVEEL